MRFLKINQALFEVNPYFNFRNTYKSNIKLFLYNLCNNSEKTSLSVRFYKSKNFGNYENIT